MVHDLLKIGQRITCLPVIHGSGDFALAVRRMMLENDYDCLAVPLPPSFQAPVEQAIDSLPTPTLVIQPRQSSYYTDWSPEQDADDLDEDPDRELSYVPIDPCQAVIAALRTAMGEHLEREFIDLETREFQPHTALLPDPYALKTVPIDRFAAAMLPAIRRVPAGQPSQRVRFMAHKLRQLESVYKSVLFVCNVLEWPWVREAYSEGHLSEAEHEQTADPIILEAEKNTLAFMLGELPFITGLYERARSELEDDENLSIDGVKELLLAARDAYKSDFGKRARKITTHHLTQCLRYIRNLSLIERRMTPDLYTIVIAAKQIAGDQFALHVAEQARDYPGHRPTGYETVTMGIDEARLPDGDVVDLVSRLPGHPVSWRSCQLQRKPDRQEVDRWKMQWNPFSHCSYPPEDKLIENFRAHVFDRAKAIMGADEAQVEKFTTSIKDGIDIRETIRHWYDGDIYVKTLPPSRGNLDCTVMLFDSPADPRDYPWRTTWFAEHKDESTLGFFATNYQEEMVGPGIGMATYGGAVFLYPPRPIPDLWHDPRIDYCETLEERLLAAACLHSDCSQIALLSSHPPGAGWRRLARRYKKKWVHVPLGQFSDPTVGQLRMVHVLNGKEVRSYAAHFIRRA